MTVTSAPGGHRLTVAAAVLTVGTGAIDVASFSRLGNVFSSVMTGNLIVFGYGISNGKAGMIIYPVIAVAGYGLGVLAGTFLAGHPRPEGPVWPSRVTVCLYAELLMLCGFTIGWEVTGAGPGTGTQPWLLAIASVAMGMQSAAMRGLGGRAAVSTTYLTGTLTGVVSTLLTPGRRGRIDLRGIAVLAGLTAGASVGGLTIATFPAALPVIPLAALGAVIATAR